MLFACPLPLIRLNRTSSRQAKTHPARSGPRGPRVGGLTRRSPSHFLATPAVLPTAGVFVMTIPSSTDRRHVRRREYGPDVLRNAFTIIELLVVIAIITILIAI